MQKTIDDEKTKYDALKVVTDAKKKSQDDEKVKYDGLKKSYDTCVTAKTANHADCKAIDVTVKASDTLYKANKAAYDIAKGKSDASDTLLKTATTAKKTSDDHVAKTKADKIKADNIKEFNELTGLKKTQEDEVKDLKKAYDDLIK